MSKEVHGWLWPDKDTGASDAVLYEWNTKSECAISLCEGRDVAVQAGGNVGVFPAKLARVFKDVITFEPYQPNLECFHLNIARRGVENITLHEAALSNDNCSVAITEAPANNCGAVQVGGEGSIPAITLDSLNLSACDLIWLDVEGYEWNAILGAKETIKKYKPVIILENKGLIEGMGGDFDGSDVLRDKMKELGYKHIKRIMRDDFFVHEDML